MKKLSLHVTYQDGAYLSHFLKRGINGLIRRASVNNTERHRVRAQLELYFAYGTADASTSSSHWPNFPDEIYNLAAKV
jgi:GDP-D-mannose dehydratase